MANRPALWAVGRIVRPHGIRGEVFVEIHTDDPGRRFTAGAVLVTEPARPGPLTITAVRPHAKGLLVTFTGIADRTQAELLRGVWLSSSDQDLAADDPPDADVYHDQQLIGLTVVTVSGEPVGTVTDVLHHGQDLLVVSPAPGRPGGPDVLVPFVAAIVTAVDLTGGQLVIDPPPGLLDLATGLG